MVMVVGGNGDDGACELCLSIVNSTESSTIGLGSLQLLAIED